MDGIKGEDPELAPQSPEKKTSATAGKKNPEPERNGSPDHLPGANQTSGGILTGDYNWGDVSLMLHAYADFQMRAWLCAGYGEISLEGNEPADFAQNAIRKMLTGQRKWNPVTCPDLMMFLRGVVRSDLSEAMRKASRTDRNYNTSEAIPENFEINAQPTTASDTALELAQLLVKIHQEVNKRKDDVLAACWNAFLHGTGKPSDISEELGLPVARIYNAQRRLRGLFRRFKP